VTAAASQRSFMCLFCQARPPIRFGTSETSSAKKARRWRWGAAAFGGREAAGWRRWFSVGGGFRGGGFSVGGGFGFPVEVDFVVAGAGGRGIFGKLRRLITAVLNSAKPSWAPDTSAPV